MTRVKICGFTRREDAEHAIECGADALGFVMEPSSSRYIGPAVRDLVGGVEPYALCVGVYGRFDAADQDVFNCVQFSDLGSSSSILSSVGLSRLPPVIRVVNLRPEEPPELTLKLLRDWQQHTQIKPRGLLLDAFVPGMSGGTGKTVDWDMARSLVEAADVPVILAGGLNPQNVAEAIRKVRPYAVDVSTGVEADGRPREKDPAKVRDFIQAAKAAL